MSRTVCRKATALAMARERRRTLDRERDAQDRKIEEATATVLVALDQRDAAQHALDEASAVAGRALRALTRLDVSVERMASLVELPLTEVRRLIRSAGKTPVVDQIGTVSSERGGEESGAGSRAG